MLNVLYVSYDGMSDPLGQSQVIPYLQGLSKCGHSITILSTEKKERYEKQHKQISQLLEGYNIKWEYVFYTKRPPVISTLYDIYKLFKKAKQLHAETPFQLLHCRSYISALIGLQFKRNKGIGFLFDMRGFWADERVDGGIWNLSNPIFKIIYNYFKRKEQAFLTEADYTISLTYNAKDEILNRTEFSNKSIPIEVIPCCADLNLFKPQSLDVRNNYRQILGINDNTFLWVYLGSIGTWYLLDEMLDFFSAVNSEVKNMKLLFITTDSDFIILNGIKKAGISKDDVIIRSAGRSEVPGYLSACDGALFFIKQAYSKRASSPVKHAEMLGSHLLSITNSGVGDVDMINAESKTGITVQEFSKSAYLKAYYDFVSLKGSHISNYEFALQKYYNLEEGISKYESVYLAIEKGRKKL